MSPQTERQKHIGPGLLLLAGLASIPAFLFQRNLLLMIVQTGSFFLAAALAGKKIRPLPPIIMVATITVLNMFSPIGRVIVTIGRLNLTLGALRLGLVKSFTLIGLIYLSRATVRSDLRLPGRFGGIITRTFYYFDQILEKWQTIPKQKIIPRLDALIAEIYRRGPGEAAPPDAKSQEPTQTDTSASVSTTGLGIAAAAVFILVQWSLFGLQYLVGTDLISRL